MDKQTLNFFQQCKAEMEAYRQLTQDKSFGSRVENGKMQLIRVTYDAKGKSSIEERGPWVSVDQWLDWLKGQML